MATHTIAAGHRASGWVTLAAGVVDTFTFADNLAAVRVLVRGTTDVYATTDGTEPTVDSTRAHCIPGADLVVDELATTNSAGGDVVKLISAGTPQVRVERHTPPPR